VDQKQRPSQLALTPEGTLAVGDVQTATCPTCRCRGEFEYLGEQHWPEEIAAKFNLPAVILLWSCPCCHTTVSESELLPARDGVPGTTNVSNPS